MSLFNIPAIGVVTSLGLVRDYNCAVIDSTLTNLHTLLRRKGVLLFMGGNNFNEKQCCS